MKKIAVFLFGILISFNIFATNIIPKLTNTCPYGYKIVNKTYCAPFNSSNYNHVIKKLKKTCPYGYFLSGSSGYCMTRNNNRVLIEKIGNSCPSGYISDGSSGYCKKH